MSDPFNDPEVQAWAERVLEELVPMIRDSVINVSIVPTGESDVKFAVELGMSIMLDKPIILAIAPGQHVPAKLAKIADEIVELPFDRGRLTEDDHARMQAAITRVIKTLDDE